MKNSIKSMAAVFMAGLVMTGCIDTAVAPEVKAIREQQVALLAAQAQLAVATAKKQEIANDYQVALNANLVKKGDAQLVADLAAIDVSVDLAKQNLADQQLLTQTSINALADYIASHPAVHAQDLLDAYQGAVDDLDLVVGNEITAAADLAKAQTILNSANAPWDLVKAGIQEQIDVETAKLTAQNAALVDLKAATTGSVSNADLQTKLTADNATLTTKITTDSASLGQATADYNAARLTKKIAADTVSDYNAAADSVSFLTDWISDDEAAVTEKTADLAAANAALTLAKSDLAAWEAILAPLESTLNAKQADLDAKEATLTAKINALQVAQANQAAGTGTAAQTTAAQTAKDAAQTAKDAAETARNTAETNYNTVNNDANYASAQAAVGPAQTVADNAQTALDGAQDDLTDDTRLKVNADATVARLQAPFDAVDMVALQADVDAKSRVVAGLSASINASNQQVIANTFVLNSLKNYFDDLSGQVKVLEDMIKATNATIYSLQQNMDSQDGFKAAKAAIVAQKQTDLDRAQAAVAAQQAIVDLRLSELNKALGL